MNKNQKIIRVFILLAILCIIIITVFGIIQVTTSKKGKVDNDKMNVTEKTPVAKPIIGEPNATIDKTLPPEQQAITLIVNQGKYKKSDLKFIERTEDGRYKILNKKLSSERRQTYHIVDINQQTFEIVTTGMYGSGSE